jgi:hypothetical protein
VALGLAAGERKGGRKLWCASGLHRGARQRAAAGTMRVFSAKLRGLVRCYAVGGTSGGGRCASTRRSAGGLVVAAAGTRLVASAVVAAVLRGWGDGLARQLLPRETRQAPCSALGAGLQLRGAAASSTSCAGCCRGHDSSLARASCVCWRALSRTCHGGATGRPGVTHRSRRGCGGHPLCSTRPN